MKSISIRLNFFNNLVATDPVNNGEGASNGSGDASGGTSTGIIIAVVTVILVVIIVLFGWYCYRKKKNDDVSSMENNTTMTISVDNKNSAAEGTTIFTDNATAKVEREEVKTQNQGQQKQSRVFKENEMELTQTSTNSDPISTAPVYDANASGVPEDDNKGHVPRVATIVFGADGEEPPPFQEFQ